MQCLCTETSRSYLGRSVGRGNAKRNRKSRPGGTGRTRPRRCGELPAASERTGNKRDSGIARREGILVVTGQKSAEVVVAAGMGRRAQHEQTRRSREYSRPIAARYERRLHYNSIDYLFWQFLNANIPNYLPKQNQESPKTYWVQVLQE